jgi:hypothetical protein
MRIAICCFRFKIENQVLEFLNLTVWCGAKLKKVWTIGF